MQFQVKLWKDHLPKAKFQKCVSRSRYAQLNENKMYSLTDHYYKQRILQIPRKHVLANKPGRLYLQYRAEVTQVFMSLVSV